MGGFNTGESSALWPATYCVDCWLSVEVIRDRPMSALPEVPPLAVCGVPSVSGLRQGRLASPVSLHFRSPSPPELPPEPPPATGAPWPSPKFPSGGGPMHAAFDGGAGRAILSGYGPGEGGIKHGDQTGKRWQIECQ